jgi:hypothetical protein
MTKTTKDKIFLIAEIILTVLLIFQLARWVDTKYTKAQEFANPAPTNPA